MKKRVLLISYYFAPQNTIGAIRPTKMAKYLERMGYDVTVVCGAGLYEKVDPTLKRDLEQLKDVHLIREWNPLRERAIRKAQARQAAAPATADAKRDSESVQPASSGLVSLLKGLAGKVLDNLYLYLFWLSDRDFGRRAKREIRKLSGVYDCVLSTYATISVHEVGFYAKKTGKAKKWIADFRDEVNMAFAWQAGRQRRYIQMVRRNADLLTGVSYGVLDMMDMEKTGRVLTNGFDREDLPSVNGAAVRSDDRLRIVYCGYISEGRKNAPNRDLSPMMKTIRTLIDDRTLEQDEVQLVYAGSQSPLFVKVAEEYGLQTCVEDHGMVSRQESIRLQLGADILLMASWHMTGRKGILTGKLFEYMMMNKPVVCCMSGDLTGSDVKGVLDTTGIGFCYEQAAGQADADALQAFVKDVVNRKHQGQPLMDTSRIDAINAYSYPELVARMASWIDE